MNSVKINSVNDLQNYIKSILKLKNISSTEMSERLNISLGGFSNRLNKPYMSITILLEICNALDCDLEVSITPREH